MGQGYLHAPVHHIPQVPTYPTYASPNPYAGYMGHNLAQSVPQAAQNPGRGAARPDTQLQQTCTIRNAVNLKKNSLAVTPRASDPNLLDVSFKFDSSSPCSVTVFFMAKEDIANGCAIVEPGQLPGRRVMYPKGLALQYPPEGEDYPPGHALELSLHKPELLNANDGERWPLIIRLETLSDGKGGPAEGESLSSLPVGSRQPTWVQSQTTFATFTVKDDGSYGVKVQQQKIWVNGTSYELQEIYGMESSSSSSQGTTNVAEMDYGSECVICMSNRRDTTVLPCRHMCMCSECAQQLRHRTNRCPICREVVESLLHIKLKSREEAREEAKREASEERPRAEGDVPADVHAKMAAAGLQAEGACSAKEAH
uniref:RING-type E3 ubiquitin transferase n=1 Tax=Tetraselmis sp. GSL018 TaxID=582737 RepID=A0A061S626_9CHLO|eukprot:CAMPEP_0177603130 /NCGR_PEP_ID=MMETSP0419_2-20121207/15321_1 /TAXON_ID=582737 /ORGANISM="Tetraselmis sp., Strain GSL018" /LENGTH=367 /DNA_ID=CAMNT_0019096827 /DNA_START=763 /DNA_END=1866 /DNA_ORIENTATION=-